MSFKKYKDIRKKMKTAKIKGKKEEKKDPRKLKS